MLLLRAPPVSCEGGLAPLGQKESAQRSGRKQRMLCKFEDFFGLRSGHSRKPLKEFFDRSTILKVLEQSTDGNPGSAKNIFSALYFRALLNRKAILPAHRGILALVFNVSTDQRISFFNLQQCSKSLYNMHKGFLLSEGVSGRGHADRVKKKNTATNIFLSR